MPVTKTGISYCVRESKRARKVTIKVWPSAVVEVIVPQGYQVSRLAEIVEGRAGWINRKVKGLLKNREIRRPRSINLRAIQEKWSIRYDSRTEVDRLTVVEDKGFQLDVSGNVNDAESIHEVLNQWVNHKAKQFLPVVLKDISNELGITYNRVVIRRQKTVWGSCSGKRNINLNQNLMFLPVSMARHTLVHELCHIREMNHSSRFWNLLQHYVPDSKAIRSKFKKAIYMVPYWARRS